ncbi:ATP-binding cassette domain-containing protein [Pseudonocardia sp. TRM90224]|uniref:ATP-binding cassette domain-containing protein n=1 Tax=Pseudonocardia sp. TRM90224 TaxID=2812678 RepID=UPI001E2FE8DE|nr:ATP-binding cassette domain-containing protein [Pseudonocardia sp. TRM90224]
MGLRMEGVGKRYGRGPVIVDGIELAAEPGLPVVIAGANGSGKTTLLRIAAGATAPTWGRVTGRPKGVGYVPDRFPAHLRMPVGAYLRHMRRVRCAGGDAAVLTSAVLADLGFTADPGVPMNQLSKGNAQKVGLAQALAGGAELLVLDEPWSGLDVAARPALTSAVAAAAESGAMVVVTDHTGIADALPRLRRMQLRDGKLQDGDAAGPCAVVTLLCREPDLMAGELATDPEHDVTVAAGAVTLTVPSGHVDGLLRRALQLGCSVREVRPLAAGARP